MFDLSTDLIEKLNETTTSAAISYLPGGFNQVSRALRSLSRMKKLWKIEMVESGDGSDLNFENKFSIHISKKHLDEFKREVFDPTSIAELDLESLISGERFTVQEDKDYTDSLVNSIRQKVKQLIESSVFKKVEDSINLWRASFGIVKYLTPNTVLIPFENAKKITESITRRVCDHYGNDRGYLEMIEQAILTEKIARYGGFKGIKFLAGARILSSYREYKPVFEIAVLYKGNAISESIMINNPDVCDKVTEECTSVNVIGNRVIVPKNGQFTKRFYSELKTILQDC